MNWLFDSGHAVDVVLAVIAIEFVWLVARGRDAVTVSLTLVPGALMLMALRAAIAGLDWYWIALPLTASLPVHLADLRRRGLV